MGLADFFANKRHRNSQLDLSSSENEDEGNSWRRSIAKRSIKKSKRRGTSNHRYQDHHGHHHRGGGKSKKKKKRSSKGKKSRKQLNRSSNHHDGYSSSSPSSSSSWGSESSSSSEKLSSTHNESDAFLTREELLEFPAREIRKRCRKAHLDTRKIVEKSGLVDLLYEYYKTQSKSSGISSVSNQRAQQHAHPHGASLNGHMMMDNESEQMVEILQEIIPYYGQGDPSIDVIVKDTMQKLPPYCLEKRDGSGNTLLLLCCQSQTISAAGGSTGQGHAILGLTQLLLSKGSDPNVKNSAGETCLHYACYDDTYSYESAKILVHNGAMAEMAETRFGCTPLHYASSLGDVEMCRVLLEAGALTTTVDKNGCDPISYATQSEKQECIDLLLSKGVSNQWSGQDNALRQENRLAERVDVESEWEKLIDDNSGYPYYFNKNSGESMWEDDFFAHQQKQAKMESPQKAESKDGFSRRQQLQRSRKPSSRLQDMKAAQADKSFNSTNEIASEIKYDDKKKEETSYVNVEAIQGGSGGGKRFASKEVASHGENDNKASTKNNESSSGSTYSVDKNENEEKSFEETHYDASPTHRKLVSEASFNKKLESMQNEWAKQLQKFESVEGTKTNTSKSGGIQTNVLENELAERTAEVEELKGRLEKLAMNGAIGRKDHNTSDAMIGDADVRDEEWVASSDMQALQTSLKVKEQKLKEFQEEIMELQATFDVTERKFLTLEEKQKRSVEQIVIVEDLLKKEREARNEAVDLLEQTQKGVSTEAQLARSLRDEKRRDEEELENLRKEMQEKEKEQIDRRNGLEKSNEDLRKELFKETSRATSLSQELEECLLTHNEEKRLLLKRHERELQKESEARANSDAKRDDALKRTKVAEANLAQLSKMIKDAKKMVAANEKLHRSLQIEIDKRKALHNKLEDLKGRIRVYVRVRPMNSSEKSRDCSVALVKEDKRTCVMKREDVTGRGSTTKSWDFDHIFYGADTEGNCQSDVFKDTKLLMTSAVDGFNVCIFAYGQTGSGKTYTMFGPSGEIPEMESLAEVDDTAGLAPRAAVELFQVLEARESSFKVNVTVNMFEIYNDNVRDLLAPTSVSQNLRIKLAEHSESGLVEVQGALTKEAGNAIELLDILREGSKSRSTASTKMNADSSRSHLIASIVVNLTNRRTGCTSSGKLSICDLAGSERVGKSGATGDQLKEAQSINKSLSSLGDVINALTTGSKHIPYRNHALTMLMSDSMGGNAKTLMFVCCSPSDYNSPESTNSLDFAKRCKNVTNNVNGGSGNASDVKSLKAELAKLKRKNGSSTSKKNNRAPRRPGLH